MLSTLLFSYYKQWLMWFFYYFFFIYSLIFLVKDEICMTLLPDLVFCVFCVFWYYRDGFVFFLRPYVLRYRAERDSRETTTIGVRTECASGISKMLFGLLERSSIVFHLESIQRVFGGKEICSCVIQLCRQRLHPKWGYSLWERKAG